MGVSLGKSLALYGALLSDIRSRIQHAQHGAIRAANAELVRLYWDIGRLILARRHSAGWGYPMLFLISQLVVAKIAHKANKDQGSAAMEGKG